jgi:hypothetical protein
LDTYHRAQTLGAGSYGSVVAVYNDDGQEFAMKLFIDDDDDEEECTPGMNIGALRRNICTPPSSSEKFTQEHCRDGRCEGSVCWRS